jgi:hypothetical protein
MKRFLIKWGLISFGAFFIVTSPVIVAGMVRGGASGVGQAFRSVAIFGTCVISDNATVYGHSCKVAEKPAPKPKPKPATKPKAKTTTHK